jgi:hypothetical protein
MWSIYGEQSNPAVHCEGLLVVDVDIKSGGPESLQALDLAHGFKPTLVVRTPSGGRHLYFKLPEGHPGVSNSVSALGQGLDIRSTGGYVLGPGAVTATGQFPYAWEMDEPIAEAPEWLIAKCGAVRPLKAVDRATDAVEPDQELARRRAAEILQRSAVPVEGTRNRALYLFICKIREETGIDKQGATSVGLDFGRRCGLSEEETLTTVRSALRTAQNASGSRGVLTSDFPVLDRSATPHAAPQVKKGRLRSLSEVASPTSTTPYLIKGLLSCASYCVLHGMWGSGKTFVALDMAYHVAAGAEWHGHKVHQGPTLYLAYEGVGGLAVRAEALIRHYGNRDVPMYFDAARYDLRSPEGRAELGATIKGMPAKPALIVIDTLAHALCGGDENSAQDVSAFNTGVQGLIEHTHACVVVIHHPKKTGDSGPRGSGALPGAVDTELEVKEHVLTPRKQRDMECCAGIPFALKTVPLGIDEDGDTVTSCVVTVAGQDCGPVAEEYGAVDPGFIQAPRYTGNNENAWKHLCRLTSTSNLPVSMTALTNAFCASYTGSRDAGSRMVRRAVDRFAADGIIVVKLSADGTQRAIQRKLREE